MKAVSINETSPSESRDGLKEFWRGMRTSIPVVLSFLPFGIVLGSQAAHHMLSSAEVAMMTALNFGGGSEFAAIALWSTPPNILLIVAITLLINSRHLLMGAVLAPALRHLPRKRALVALFFMCDESWAFSLADSRQRLAKRSKPGISLPFYWGVALPLYLVWIGSTALGASIGPAIGDIERYGLHMAFPAVFLVLMRGMWKGFRFALPWALSLAAAAATYLTVSGPWYVLAGAIVGVAAGYWMPASDADSKEVVPCH